MTYSNSLYSELKPEVEAVATPLFELSETFLRKRGNFLPHAAVLTESGQVKLVAAAPNSESDYTNSAAILPILHQGLRAQANEQSLIAVGVAENVAVTQEGQRPTKAIKVLFEHKRGLTVALYLPFQKKFLREYTVGAIFVVPANAEINAWGECSS